MQGCIVSCKGVLTVPGPIGRPVAKSQVLAVGFQVEKVTAVGQSKSNNVWI
jgi:hypothetical protein